MNDYPKNPYPNACMNPECVNEVVDLKIKKGIVEDKLERVLKFIDTNVLHAVWWDQENLKAETRKFLKDL